jgi:hypothetical protein
VLGASEIPSSPTVAAGRNSSALQQRCSNSRELCSGVACNRLHQSPRQYVRRVASSAISSSSNSHSIHRSPPGRLAALLPRSGCSQTWSSRIDMTNADPSGTDSIGEPIRWDDLSAWHLAPHVAWRPARVVCCARSTAPSRRKASLPSISRNRSLMPSGRHAMRKARIALARRLAIIACHATTRV